MKWHTWPFKPGPGGGGGLSPALNRRWGPLPQAYWGGVHHSGRMVSCVITLKIESQCPSINHYSTLLPSAGLPTVAIGKGIASLAQ